MEYTDINHDKLDLVDAGTDDADEEWTEPLSHGAEATLNSSDFARSAPVSKMGHSRTIIHFDIDCFYAQVEMLRNPELRNKPLGIQQKNIVVTTNYVARTCGVPKSTYVTEAKRICPDLVLVCGEDLTNYRQMSYQISEFMQKYTPYVERLGFDENFVDVSELVTYRQKDGKYKQDFVGHVYGSSQQGTNRSLCSCGCELRLQIGSQIAADIREALQKELGITSCAGIGHNKLLAKLVAGTHKPNQQTSVLPHMAQELMSSLSSALCIPGIGFRTSQRLNAFGISSVLDLQASDQKVLEKEFGQSMAQLMVQLSYGVDDSPVISYSQPQTLSDEDSFKCCKDLADAEHRIKDLLTSLLKRVAEDGRIPQTVRLTVRHVSQKYHRESKQCPVPGNIFTKFLQSCVTEAVVDRLMPLLMNLFLKLVDPSEPFHLTLFGICFAKLVKPADELGSISTFFTKGGASFHHIETHSNLNEKVMGGQQESICQSISKSSPPRSEVNTIPDAKVKTIKHFFLSANNETHGALLQNLIAASGKALQHTSSHPPTDVSLPVVSAKERFINSGSTNSDKDYSTAFSSLERAEECSTNSDEPDQIAVEAKNPHNRQAENISSDLDVSDKHFAITELDTSIDKSLQRLLPANVDAQIIAELPVDIQKEVLLQYGIYVEDHQQERRFTQISKKIRTRSHNRPKLAPVKVKKALRSPEKKNTPKRNPELCLLSSEIAARMSKKRKILRSEQNVKPETSQQLNVTDNVREHCFAETSPETLSKICVKNKSASCVSRKDSGQCCLNNVILSTSCEITENNPYHSGVENSRTCNSDESSSCSGIILNAPSVQPDYVPSEKCTNKSVVNCELDTDSADVLELQYTSQKVPSINDGCQGHLTDLSVVSQPTPYTSTQSCSSVSIPSHQSSQRKISQKILPTNIDSEVFSSLPSNIRGEILAHIVMGTTDSTSGQHVKNTTPEHQRNSKQIKNIKHRNQNTLLTYFKRSDADIKKMV